MAALLRVGYLSTLYHTSHLLRQLRWVEEDLAIECRWQMYGTGPEMIEAFQGLDIDIGYIGLPPALIGMAKGVPLVCVGGGHVEGTVMVAGPSFRTLAEFDETHAFLHQFRHRRVGIPAAGSIHDVIFRALLVEHSISGVDIVNVPWADLIPFMLKKGEIDAAVGTPPLAVLCEMECGARTVIPPETLWPFNPSYGIVIRKGMLKEEGSEGCCNSTKRPATSYGSLPNGPPGSQSRLFPAWTKVLYKGSTLSRRSIVPPCRTHTSRRRCVFSL